MPRTKRRTVKRPSSDVNVTVNATMANQPKDFKEILIEFEREKENIEEYFSSASENIVNLIENAFLIVKMNFGDLLNRNLYDYINQCNPEKSNNTAISSSSKKGVERPTRTATKTTAVRTTRQKSASSSRTINSATVVKHRSATRADDRPPLVEKNESKFKTPVIRPPLSASATVTPKVNMYEPISMMRRPNQGEVALSMTGSPLMVSSVSRDDMATVSVPLANGNVLSILPRAGAAMDISFDEQTKNELLVLKGNIEGLLKMNDMLKK